MTEEAQAGEPTASNLVSGEKRRTENAAFKIFAVIGFLSSIVTLWSWVNSSSAALTTSISQRSIELPKSLDLKSASAGAANIDTSASDILEKHCNPVVVDYNGSKSKNYFYNQQQCNDETKLIDTIKQIASLQSTPLIAYDVSISNTGSEAAENIKIASPIDVDASAINSDGRPVTVSVVEPHRVFSIPAMNPREMANVRLVSTTPVPAPYDDTDTKPAVTFSGGKASTKEPVYLNDNYAQVATFLDEMPLFFQLVAIIVGALIITLIWVLPISLLTTAAEKKKSASQTSGA
jgi:hypothetical protein